MKNNMTNDELSTTEVLARIRAEYAELSAVRTLSHQGAEMAGRDMLAVSRVRIDDIDPFDEWHSDELAEAFGKRPARNRRN